MQYDKQIVNLMGPMDDKRDGFDILIDHAPEKLPFVKQSLIKFANSHLANIGNYLYFGVPSVFSAAKAAQGMQMSVSPSCHAFCPIYFCNSESD